MNARAKDRSSVYTDIARAYAEQVVTGEILLARELARADAFLDLVDCADPIQRLIGQHRLGRPGARALKNSRPARGSVVPKPAAQAAADERARLGAAKYRPAMDAPWPGCGR